MTNHSNEPQKVSLSESLDREMDNYFNKAKTEQGWESTKSEENNDQKGSRRPRIKSKKIGNAPSEKREGSQPSGERVDRRDKSFNPRFNSRPGQRKFDKRPNNRTKSEYVTFDAPERETIRLNRHISSTGLCSRREADELIKNGKVKVNDVVITEMGMKINPSTDVILVHDQPIKPQKLVYILMNKPKGFVTTTNEEPNATKTVMDLIKKACKERIFPVGRLDKHTTGVLLLTNDGDLSTSLSHPQFNKRKVYHVFLDKEISAEDVERLRQGFELNDGLIAVDAANYPDDNDKTQLGVEIHSGRNRIVRRMFEHLGYHVVKLDRVYFAGLTKKNLPRGKWRFLNAREVGMLKMGSFE